MTGWPAAQCEPELYTDPDRGDLIPRGSRAQRGGARELRSSSPEGAGAGRLGWSPADPRPLGCSGSITGAVVPTSPSETPSISSNLLCFSKVVFLVDPIITLTLPALLRTSTGAEGRQLEDSSCRLLAPETEGVWCHRCAVPALACDGSIKRWSTLVEASAELTGELWGWQQQDGHLVCAACVLAEQCAVEGHQWSKWKSLVCLGGGIGEMIRFCDVCGTNQTGLVNGLVS